MEKPVLVAHRYARTHALHFEQRQRWAPQFARQPMNDPELIAVQALLTGARGKLFV